MSFATQGTGIAGDLPLVVTFNGVNNSTLASLVSVGTSSSQRSRYCFHGSSHLNVAVINEFLKRIRAQLFELPDAFAESLHVATGH
jgi:hypothetical protein